MVDRERLRKAWGVVFAGRTYSKEHYTTDPTKFVGHVPAVEYDAALDIILADLPALLNDGPEGGS